MKNIQGKALVFILWIVIAMIPLSCGTRKTATNILKNAEIVQEKQESKGEVKKTEEKKEESKQFDKTKVIDEDKEITVVELYDSVGTIKSRVTHINIKKATKNTSNNKELLKTANLASDSVYDNKIENKKEVTSFEKQKATTTNRNGLYIALGIVGIVGLLFLFKPWK